VELETNIVRHHHFMIHGTRGRRGVAPRTEKGLLQGNVMGSGLELETNPFRHHR
jgi:hypothetical protein